jgi:hypothetical protein
MALLSIILFERRAFPVAARPVEVVPAELGDDVGVLGMVAVAMAQMTSTLSQT